MTRKQTRFFAAMALVAVASVIFGAHSASATIISSTIPLSGTFSGTLGGSGTASIQSASGSYWSWVGVIFGSPTWTKVGVSASAQTKSLVVTPAVAKNLPASGTANLAYDDVTPGTPDTLNSLSADLNGAGGSNTNVPIGIATNPSTPLIITTSLGNSQLALNFNGNITDLTFTSTAAAAANPNYLIPGNYGAVISGTVTGTLVNVLGISGFNISLGTLYTVPATPLSFAGALPGTVTLSDLQGGLPPFPNDMLADFAAAFSGLPITIPLNIPIAVAQPSNTIVNGQSGFKSLFINGSLNASLSLTNVSYDLNGTVPQTLTPEPSSLVLIALGTVALTALGYRRKRAG